MDRDRPAIGSHGAIKRLAPVSVILFILACSSMQHDRPVSLSDDPGASPPRDLIVFVIHGDGDYLFHDSAGKAHKADEDALLRATSVALRNPQAEVFIFHQRSGKRLWFLPRSDGKFWYYRDGKILAEQSYDRGGGSSRFDPETELIFRYSRSGYRSSEISLPRTKLFLYFGHEIPEFELPGYDSSHRERIFKIDDLARGLSRITGDSSRFDLLVLGTCFGGTPYTIARLAPYAKYIVASPDNLHLSYFDLSPLENLQARATDSIEPSIAHAFAQQSFERLSTEIQTAVTVAVYDSDRVRGFLQSVDSVYALTMNSLKQEAPASLEYCDCSEISDFLSTGFEDGVKVFYRPPRFGRLKSKQSHSGWQCRRKKESF